MRSCCAEGEHLKTVLRFAGDGRSTACFLGKCLESFSRCFVRERGAFFFLFSFLIWEGEGGKRGEKAKGLRLIYMTNWVRRKIDVGECVSCFFCLCWFVVLRKGRCGEGLKAEGVRWKVFFFLVWKRERETGEGILSKRRGMWRKRGSGRLFHKEGTLVFWLSFFFVVCGCDCLCFDPSVSLCVPCVCVCVWSASYLGLFFPKFSLPLQSPGGLRVKWIFVGVVERTLLFSPWTGKRHTKEKKKVCVTNFPSGMTMSLYLSFFLHSFLRPKAFFSKSYGAKSQQCVEKESYNQKLFKVVVWLRLRERKTSKASFLDV